MPPRRATDASSTTNTCATAWPPLFVEVEPLAGRRHVEVTERRTRQDWARFIKTMLDERHPQAVKVRLVMDNLNTHDLASLYETFAPAEARRLAERLEIHYTPQARKPFGKLRTAGLAEHRGNRIKRAQRPVPAPPHPFAAGDATRNRCLAIRPQPSRRTGELAIHHRGRTDQTHSPISESIDVTGY